jgi:hypothetical protein
MAVLSLLEMGGMIAGAGATLETRRDLRLSFIMKAEPTIL